MAATRPEYRDPKTPKAVCVYTIAQESRYLVIENVPSLGVYDELISRCSSFGQVEEHRLLDEHTSNTEYTEVHWIKYDTVDSARMAKRKMDDKPFFTHPLRVNYAPEYETVSDMRIKLLHRIQVIHDRLHGPIRKKARQRRDEKEETVYIGPSFKEKPTNQVVVADTTTTKKRKRI